MNFIQRCFQGGITLMVCMTMVLPAQDAAAPVVCESAPPSAPRLSNSPRLSCPSNGPKEFVPPKIVCPLNEGPKPHPHKHRIRKGEAPHCEGEPCMELVECCPQPCEPCVPKLCNPPSLCSLPICCEPCKPCCPPPSPCTPKWCESKWGLYAAGAILLGAAAGAGAGYAAGNRRCNHFDVPSNCASGCGATLENVSFGAEINFEILGDFTNSPTIRNKDTIFIEFFVVTPTGCFIPTSTFEISNNLGTGMLDSSEFSSHVITAFTVPAKCCGTYEIGFTMITPYDAFNIGIEKTNIIASSSCDPELIGLNTPINFISIGNSSNGTTQFQFILAQFVIATDCCINSGCNCR